VDTNWLGHGLVHAVPRVERTDRVLKDHLDPATHLLRVGAREAAERMPVYRDRSRCGRDEAHDRPRQGRLPRARLAGDAQHLSLDDLERDLVHGANRRTAAAEEAAVGEIDHDVPQGHDRLDHASSTR
jgi:hypothetical protein